MSSARSITEAVNPPRAVYLDFPLGHTAGRAHDTLGNRTILREALEAFSTIGQPGEIRDLAPTWSADEGWKDSEPRTRRDEADGKPDSSTGDDRTERFATPQYQSEEDRIAAEAALAADGCPSCVFLE